MLRRKTAENTVSDGREQNGAPPGLGWQGQPQRTAERKDDIDV